MTDTARTTGPDHRRRASAGWKQVFQICARYWGRQKRIFGVLLAVSATQVGVDLLIPLASGLLVDRVIAGLSGEASYDPAYHAVFILTAATVGFHLLRWFRLHIWHHFLVRAMDQILCEAFANVQRFSSDWHANTFAGATVRKLTRGKWAFDSLTSIIWNNMFPVVLTILGMTAIIATKFPMIGMMFVAVIAIYIVTAGVAATIYVRPSNEKAAASDSALGGAMADTIGNNAIVKAFGAETREDQTFHGRTSHWKRLCEIAWNRGADMFLLQKLIWAVLQFLLIISFIGMVRSGRATAGDVAFILTANTMIGAYLRAMGEHIRMLQKSFSEFSDMADILTQALPPGTETDAVPIRPGPGQIEFDHVQFSYAGGKHRLYEDFSITIKAGESIGLVGPSGSGKSTFVKLIQRLYELDGGQIRIDGQDIARLNTPSLRQAVSLVPQDPLLFHRSLADNIAYGNPDASLVAIKEAARKAHATEFIDRLPDGFETLVGERGIKLSGGERQRVAIARAFLADAPIVIFDEATSSLDSITEQMIQDAMTELMRGRTTLIIAHRLSTVRHVDRILVFDNGQIVEQGHHDLLIQRPDGRYRSLYDQQTMIAATAA